jgi:hypothetical protein
MCLSGTRMRVHAETLPTAIGDQPASVCRSGDDLFELLVGHFLRRAHLRRSHDRLLLRGGFLRLTGERGSGQRHKSDSKN